MFYFTAYKFSHFLSFLKFWTIKKKIDEKCRQVWVHSGTHDRGRPKKSVWCSRKHTTSVVICNEWYWKGTGWLTLMRFEVLRVMTPTIQAFWDITTCWQVSGSWHFKGLCRLHLQISDRSAFFFNMSDKSVIPKHRDCKKLLAQTFTDRCS